MAEMNDSLVEMIDTLTQARRAVREELDHFVETEARDGAALQHFDESVRNFARQADSLLLTIQERDPTNPLLETARELSDFFEAAESEADALLAASRG